MQPRCEYCNKVVLNESIEFDEMMKPMCIDCANITEEDTSFHLTLT